ncbi:MAG: glycoside hydrolase family 36 protein [Microbacteriaceae bacterium]
MHTISLPCGALRVHSVDSVREVEGGYVLTGPTVRVEHPFGESLFYRNGWNSWSPTGWRSLAEEPLRIYDNPERLLTADDAATDDPQQHQGSALAALEAGDGNILLLGALELGAPRVAADGTALVAHADESIEWFLSFGPEKHTFQRYAALVTDRLGTARNTVGAVWSSWYSFFEDVDEERLCAVIDDLRGYPFDVVQIDDGWEPVVGDWIAGPGFPAGMPAMAARIEQAGFRPGLWLAPLICLPQSRVAIEHPEWLVRDRAGGPLVAGFNWDSHYYVLDTTLPAVQNHLTTVFRDLVDAGFTYFKLDFMYAGALPGVRSERRHRDTVYREAIELIREAVGPSTYLLGSGIPMLQSVGIFDAARVGPDVAPYWDNTERKRDPSGPGTLNSLANSAARIWMSEWYCVDPDVVFFRSRRSLLDENARRLLVDLAHVCGFKSTSDPIAWLDTTEQAQLRAFLTQSPTIEQISRWVYRIDGRDVDFGAYLSGDRREMESMLVK